MQAFSLRRRRRAGSCRFLPVCLPAKRFLSREITAYKQNNCRRKYDLSLCHISAAVPHTCRSLFFRCFVLGILSSFLDLFVVIEEIIVKIIKIFIHIVQIVRG